MKKVLIVILLLFNACGKEVTKEVKVIDKFKTEAYTKTYMMPFYNGKRTMFIPRIEYVPEKYYLTVEWIEVRKKEIEVKANEFEATKQGDVKIIKIKE